MDQQSGRIFLNLSNNGNNPRWCTIAPSLFQQAMEAYVFFKTYAATYSSIVVELPVQRAKVVSVYRWALAKISTSSFSIPSGFAHPQEAFAFFRRKFLDDSSPRPSLVHLITTGGWVGFFLYPPVN